MDSLSGGNWLDMGVRRKLPGARAWVELAAISIAFLAGMGLAGLRAEGQAAEPLVKGLVGRLQADYAGGEHAPASQAGERSGSGGRFGLR